MKKILIIALSITLLSSCSDYNKLIRRYDTTFAFKVYDGVLFEFFYTNTINHGNGYIEFVDQKGITHKMNNYSIETLVEVK